MAKPAAAETQSIESVMRAIRIKIMKPSAAKIRRDIESLETRYGSNVAIAKISELQASCKDDARFTAAFVAAGRKKLPELALADSATTLYLVKVLFEASLESRTLLRQVFISAANIVPELAAPRVPGEDTSTRAMFAAKLTDLLLKMSGQENNSVATFAGRKKDGTVLVVAQSGDVINRTSFAVIKPGSAPTMTMGCYGSALTARAPSAGSSAPLSREEFAALAEEASAYGKKLQRLPNAFFAGAEHSVTLG